MADSQQNNKRTTHVGPVVEPDTLGSPPWNAKAAKASAFDRGVAFWSKLQGKTGTTG